MPGLDYERQQQQEQLQLTRAKFSDADYCFVKDVFRIISQDRKYKELTLKERVAATLTRIKMHPTMGAKFASSGPTTIDHIIRRTNNTTTTTMTTTTTTSTKPKGRPNHSKVVIDKVKQVVAELQTQRMYSLPVSRLGPLVCVYHILL
jgi:hypothetical protein